LEDGREIERARAQAIEREHEREDRELSLTNFSTIWPF